MLESAKLKLDRAKKHIGDLQATFDSFVQRSRHTFLSGSDSNTGEITVELSFNEQIPSDLSLIMADATHNLRTSLDHAMWELIGLDGGTQDRWTTLPTGSNRQNYEATCNGAKTPRHDTKRFLIELAVYKSGAGNDVYGLHLLDNEEKHTVITPIAGLAKIGKVRFVGPNGGTISTMTNNFLGLDANGRARIAGMGPGITVELDQDANPTIDVFFRDVEGGRLKSVAPTLMHLCDVVADCLQKFETFITTRK
jgi:hypothetical protein